MRIKMVQKNPDYKGTFVFENDFPALLDEQPHFELSNEGGQSSAFVQKNDQSDLSQSGVDFFKNQLFQSQIVRGNCKVMCFHPKSNMTLPLMLKDEVLAVIEKWVELTVDLGRKYRWVQIFENKGAVMGCSNPHPHCQIWSTDFLPNIPKLKEKSLKEYWIKNGRNMLMDYVAIEVKGSRERIILENTSWVWLVPYWACWPFETMLLPKKHVPRLSNLTQKEKDDLAEMMIRLLTRYDNLFECSFPYSMGWHGAPTGIDCEEYEKHWQLHATYLPPLLRSATVKKFMAGFEMVAQPQRDLTQEMAAQRLRELSDVHYKRR